MTNKIKERNIKVCKIGNDQHPAGTKDIAQIQRQLASTPNNPINHMPNTSLNKELVLIKGLELEAVAGR